ncbi:hypothetical protein DRB17_05555 [Ferruginivarius sediminum]|uniref:Uncharacterized protein n=1 Tax=Ferruginivarius sediminum TaxID=2661937 RepID=A0A369TES4_9PROT|nr:hypothetical protein DRB17_05555 [Ferruginivarius sediminum]
MRRHGGSKKVVAYDEIGRRLDDVTFAPAAPVMYGDALCQVAAQQGRTVRLQTTGGFRNVDLHDLCLENGEAAQI